MQLCDLILFIVELLMMIGLFVVSKVSCNIRNTKWKLLYVVPALFVMIMLVIAGFEIAMLPAYVASLIVMAGFFKENALLRKWVCIIGGALVFVTSATVDYYPGYRETDYVKEFENAFDTMRAHYVLSDYKGIDWDKLYDTYHEKFENVKKQHDPIENIITWKQFCYEFHDGHVNYVADEEGLETAMKRKIGNDYGLSLVTLSGGETVAVNVEENSQVYQSGIRNGTVITKWNGSELTDSFNKVDMSIINNMPLKENEDFYRSILAAGIGDDVNTISFLDEKGKEQTIDVQSMGSYYNRFKDTVDVIDQGVEASNLEFKEITEDTFVLRIKNMQYDTDSYADGNHTEMQNELRDKLNQLKLQNVTHLIIDIRNNGGGSPHMIMAIAQLFAPVQEYQYAWEGVFDNKSASYEKESDGRYKKGDSFTFTGENVWENRKVTILVNAQSISAADHFVSIMKMLDLDNVTIMGFHKTNASAQAISGIPLKDGMITYSCIPALTGDGEVLIDPDKSREGGIELDEKISFDMEAVTALFDKGEDYLLMKAMEK